MRILIISLILMLPLVAYADIIVDGVVTAISAEGHYDIEVD